MLTGQAAFVMTAVGCLLLASISALIASIVYSLSSSTVMIRLDRGRSMGDRSNTGSSFVAGPQSRHRITRSRPISPVDMS